MAFKARAFVVVLFLVALGCTQEGAASRLSRSLEHDFSQHLSSGAPKSAVVAFLKEHRIQYEETPGTRMITGWSPDVQNDLVGKAHVHLTFYFDGNDRLTKHEFRVDYIAL